MQKVSDGGNSTTCSTISALILKLVGCLTVTVAVAWLSGDIQDNPQINPGLHIHEDNEVISSTSPNIKDFLVAIKGTPSTRRNAHHNFLWTLPGKEKEF